LGSLLLSAAAAPVHAEGTLTSTAAASSSRVGGVAALSDKIEQSNVPAPGSGVEWGRAEGTLGARPDAVLAVLRDYARYAGLFPYFEKSRVLSQRGTDAIVYLEAKILHGATTLWGQMRISAKAAADQTQVIEAKLMKGKGNMAQFLARWEVTPVMNGSRSHVVFQMLVDPDLPVPDSMISREMKNGAGQAFRALRRRVNEAAATAPKAATLR
jgi:ribosome-associated toxin RatA of RatAB toxin-antitoxin module